MNRFLLSLLAADATRPTDGDRHDLVMAAVAERVQGQHCAAE
ncbi:hypothetical protein [Candidatus Poriferisodalis sp.]